MRRIVLPVRVLLLSSLFAISGPAWGQDGICSQDPDDDDCVFGGLPFEIPSEFRDPATANSFSLSPPGARSLAMGGAFLGLADDATAAYTNPAGLTNLAVGGAEVTVEVRGAQYSSSFADRGHYKNDTSSTSGPDLTHTGQDFVDGLQFGKADGDVTGLSFLSYGFVLPGGLTVALYRHELGNFQSSFEAQGPFNDDNCGEGAQRECELFRVQPSRSSIDLEIINYGASAAYAFDVGSASSLSVGIGVSYYESEMHRIGEVFDVCRFDQFDPDEPLDPVPGGSAFPCTQNEVRSRMPGGFYGVADFSPDNSFIVTKEAGTTLRSASTWDSSGSSGGNGALASAVFSATDRTSKRCRRPVSARTGSIPLRFSTKCPGRLRYPMLSDWASPTAAPTVRPRSPSTGTGSTIPRRSVTSPETSEWTAMTTRSHQRGRLAWT